MEEVGYRGMRGDFIINCIAAFHMHQQNVSVAVVSLLYGRFSNFLQMLPASALLFYQPKVFSRSTHPINIYSFLYGEDVSTRRRWTGFMALASLPSASAGLKIVTSAHAEDT